MDRFTSSNVCVSTVYLGESISVYYTNSIHSAIIVIFVPTFNLAKHSKILYQRMFVSIMYIKVGHFKENYEATCTLLHNKWNSFSVESIKYNLS